METLLLGSAVAAGYLLSKNGKNNRQELTSKSIYKAPSQDSIYSSNYSNKTLEKERSLANKNFNNSKNTIDTNVVPPHFNSKLFNKETTPIKYLQTSNNSNDKSYISELSGLSINKEDFTSKNLPFFGSHIRQSGISNNNNIVENHTGIESFTQKKNTPIPLFEPTVDKNINYGTQNKTNEMKNRFVASRYKKGELPFQQVRVGPGIDNDDLSGPTGGFHQDTRKHIIPKSIDDLRPKSNPQISYKGRVIPGKAINSKMASTPVLVKNRPDTFYINSSDRYFTTSSGILKETQRPHQIIKDTNRKDSVHYSGSAAPVEVIQHTKQSLYKKSTKQNFETDGPRNLHKNGFKTNDYGKDSINIGSNEREITGKRTHTSNVTTIVKSIIAPILDAMKPTRKENVEENIRQTGNLASSNISKNVVWDPNDKTRTTIKETNIHDTRTGNIQSTNSDKGVVWDPNDKTKTTIKETNIHDTRTGNIQSTNSDKGVVWDPNDKTRTTIKETNIHDVRTGNIQTTTSDGATVIDKKSMKFRTTIRETITPEEINLNMKVVEKLSVKDPNDKAKTTIKETNIHDVRSGNIAGPVKLTVYDPNNIAKTTIKETNIHNDHTGYIGGVSVDSGYINNKHEAPNTNRQFTSDYEYEGIADMEHNGGLGYLTNEKEAPNTNRQFTSDYEYGGTANSMYKKSTSNSSSKNMRTNGVREGTLKGRHPTPQGTKVSNDKTSVNVDTKKIESDIINDREIRSDKVYNSIPELDPCSLTQDKNQYNYKIMDERIDPGLLNAFNKNPYTQSLSSYAYN
tara:strand:- start:921 stop:3311 length:2391 start_codon:yes stop_codon:yes gene_type:complete